MKYIPFWFILGVILGSRFNHGSARLLDRECGISPLQRRIAGGETAIQQSTPWMAFLHNNTNYICGGSLIAKAYVLTAAHCVSPTPNNLLARLGEYDWSPHKPCLVRSGCIQSERDYKISDIYTYPQYKTVVNDDIAILKLEKEVYYTAKIRPICVLVKGFLDEWQQYLIQQKNLMMTGWGGSKNTKISYVLQTANLTQVDLNTCRSKYNYPVDESHICAGDLQQHACPGDSGSPMGLMLPNTYYYIQLGIVSNGRIPCQGVSVFTNVLRYSKWIAEVTTNNNRNKPITTLTPPTRLSRDSLVKPNRIPTNVLSDSEWIAEVTTNNNRNIPITTRTPPTRLFRDSLVKPNSFPANVLSNSEWIAEVTTNNNRNIPITTLTPPTRLFRDSLVKPNRIPTNVLSNSDWIAEVTTNNNRNKPITTLTPPIRLFRDSLVKPNRIPTNVLSNSEWIAEVTTNNNRNIPITTLTPPTRLFRNRLVKPNRIPTNVLTNSEWIAEVTTNNNWNNTKVIDKRNRTPTVPRLPTQTNYPRRRFQLQYY